MKTITYGGEFMRLHDDGQIERTALNLQPSGQWRVTGAIRCNNFGHIVERASLADILAGRVKDWQHKNGKQRWFVEDTDHGTHRVWMSPAHSIC